MLLEGIEVVPNSNPMKLSYAFKCSCGDERILEAAAG